VEFAEFNSHYTAAGVTNQHNPQSFDKKKASSVKQADLRNILKKAFKSVSTSTIVVSPGLFSYEYGRCTISCS
jgi:hypothetical protein